MENLKNSDHQNRRSSEEERNGTKILEGEDTAPAEVQSLIDKINNLTLETSQEQTKSIEEKAFEIELVADAILNFVDFSTLTTCRQVSKTLNWRATKILYAHNFLTLTINVSKKMRGEDGEENLPWEEKTKQKAYDQHEIEPTSEAEMAIELEKDERIQSFFSIYGDKIKFKNLRLHLTHEASSWLALEPDRFKICGQLSHHVTHLHIDAPFSIWLCLQELVTMMSRLLPNLRSLHLPFLHVDEVTDLRGGSFLQTLNTLKVLQVDMISHAMIQSLLLLKDEAGVAIKNLNIRTKIYLGPLLIAMYVHFANEFKFRWQIRDAKINLFPVALKLVRLFLEGQENFLEKLSISIVPDPPPPEQGEGPLDLEAVYNFSYDYLPTLRKLKRLKISKNIQISSFIARNFCSAVSMPRLEEFKFSLGLQIHFSTSAGPKNYFLNGSGNLDIFTRISGHLLTHGLAELALDLQMKTDEKLKEKLAPHDMNRLASQFSIGQSLTRQKKFGEALSVLIDLVKILGQKLDQSKPSSLMDHPLHFLKKGAMDFCLNVYEGRHLSPDPDTMVSDSMNPKLGVNETQTPEEDEMTLRVLNLVAHIFVQMEKVEEGLQLFKKLNQLDATRFGAKHAKTQESHVNMIQIHQALGRPKEALVFERKLMQIQMEALGPNDPVVLENQMGLAHSLLNNKLDDEALTILNQNCQLSSKALGPQHEVTMGSKYLMSQALNNLQKYEEALGLSTQNFEMHAKIFGKNSQQTLCNLYQMGRALRGLGENQKAAQVYRDFVQGQLATVGPDDEETLVAQHELGTLLKQMGQFEEAEGFFKLVYETRVRILGKEHPDSLDTFREMESLVEAKRKK